MSKKIKYILFTISALFFIGMMIFVWAFFIEPYILIVNNITVFDSQLSGIRVAYISDIHACEGDETFLQRIVNRINEYQPDLILLGGDYIVVDMFYYKSMKPESIASCLSGLKAKHGVYLVMGNHDSYQKANDVFKEKLADKGIKILQNSNDKIRIKDKDLWLVGIGDFSCYQHRIKKAFKDVEKPVLAFTHSPDVFTLIPDYTNFLFAGHTHGGQVSLPFYGPLKKPVKLNGDYWKGFYQSNGKKMFVSSGIGTSHLRVRFFNIPEIIIADFK